MVRKTDNFKQTRLKGSWLRKTSDGASVLQILDSRVQKHTLLKQVPADPKNLYSCFSGNATNFNNYCCEKIHHGDDGYPIIQVAFCVLSDWL